MAKNIYYCILLLLLCWSCRGRVSDDTITVTLPDVLGSEQADDDSPTVQEDDDNNPDVVTTIPSNAEPIIEDAPKTLQDVYLSQVGVKEATGNNDGPEVEKYLRSTGLGKGFAWCAAFVHWCLEEVDIPNTVNAWSPTAENKNNLVFKLRQFREEPQAGDVVTFYYANLGRIGHTGFFNKKISDVTYESVEGNTNSSGSREAGNGGGVYKKYRSFNSTHSISRWEKPQD